MNSTTTLSRRQFLGRAAMFTAAATALPSAISAAAEIVDPWKFCAFEKPLQFLSFDELADLLAELGFNGVEATVRPGGHVLPERVEEDLPKFVEALKKRGLEITILTSGINSVAQPHTEKVLRTAAKLGIQRYRMLWWQYDLKQPIWPQVESFRPVLKDLVALNCEVGISGLYQNHSGPKTVGASLWDIYSLIKDYQPKDIGLAYDVYHAQVEGGLSWPAQFNLVKSHITAVCIKDFIWVDDGLKDMPVGKGRLNRKIIPMLKEAKFTGPMSIHVEYFPNDSRDKQAIGNAFGTDLETWRAWLKSS